MLLTPVHRARCAGHETTAAVCTWTLFCLMQNEEAEAKCLAEIDAVVGDRMPSEWPAAPCRNLVGMFKDGWSAAA